MFNLIMGNLDAPAATVLVAMCATLTIISATTIINYQSREQITHKFELAKMELELHDQADARVRKNNHEIELAKIAANREVEFKRIDSGMIELQASGGNHAG